MPVAAVMARRMDLKETIVKCNVLILAGAVDRLPLRGCELLYKTFRPS